MFLIRQPNGQTAESGPFAAHYMLGVMNEPSHSQLSQLEGFAVIQIDDEAEPPPAPQPAGIAGEE